MFENKLFISVMNAVRQIPNILTLCNLVCGFFCILCAAEGRFETAALLISAGTLFDFTDGFAARLLKASSDIGKQLDSLSDLITFGLAPAFLVWSTLSEKGISGYDKVMIAGICALLPVTAAIRLARFNNDTSGKADFSGLPSPAAGLFFSFLTLYIIHNQGSINKFISQSDTQIIMVIFISALMIAPISMPSLKIKATRGTDNNRRILTAVILALSIIITTAVDNIFTGLLIVIPLYVLLSVFFTITGNYEKVQSRN